MMGWVVGYSNGQIRGLGYIEQDYNAKLGIRTESGQSITILASLKGKEKAN